MTAIEFAAVGPVFIFMILEFFQSALLVYNSTALNRATQGAARQIMIGNASQSQKQFINNTLCPLLPASIPCSNVIVNVQTVTEATDPSGFYNFVNSARTGLIIPPLDNAKTSFCPGGSGQYVYMQVLYPMPLLGAFWPPTLTTTYQGQTVTIVVAAAAFKNESYQSSYTPPAGC